MSNAKLKFSDEIARFLQMFSGLSAYADEVGKIGSLEQAKSDAEKLSAKAQSELTALLDEIAKHKADHAAECAAQKQEADDYSRSVMTKADEYANSSQETLAKSITDAKEEAVSIIARARDEATKITSAATARMASQKQLVDEAQKKLDALNIKTEKTQLLFDELTKHVEEMKVKFS